MNILLFVMTLLMLLTMMTYGRIESYRGFVFMQSQFKNYMEKSERNEANKGQESRYDHEKGSTKKPNPNPSQRNPASSLLSFNLFIDKEAREKNASSLDVQRLLAKNLMTFLYGDQPFFISLQEKRSYMLDDLLDALMKASDGLTKEKKLNLKKVEELATLNLEDVELNELFTKMLRGSIEPVEMRDEHGVARPDFKPIRGYFSLLDFLTLKKDKLKLRVFLAAPQLLMAVYGNPQLVSQIIETRKNFYTDLIAKRIEVEPATQAFQQMFQNSQLPSIPSNVLDYGVSKTRPP